MHGSSLPHSVKSQPLEDRKSFAFSILKAIKYLKITCDQYSAGRAPQYRLSAPSGSSMGHRFHFCFRFSRRGFDVV